MVQTQRASRRSTAAARSARCSRPTAGCPRCARARAPRRRASTSRPDLRHVDDLFARAAPRSTGCRRDHRVAPRRLHRRGGARSRGGVAAGWPAPRRGARSRRGDAAARAARPPAALGRGGAVRHPVERALLVQIDAPPARAPADRRAAGAIRSGRGRGRRGAAARRARTWRWCWRTRATTTRASCCRSRAPRPGSAGIVRDVGVHGRRGGGRARRAALRTIRCAAASPARDIVRGVVRGSPTTAIALGVPNLGGDVWLRRRLRRQLPGERDGASASRRAPASSSSRVPGRPGSVGIRAGGQADRRGGFGGAAFASERARRRRSARRGAAARSLPQARAPRGQRRAVPPRPRARHSRPGFKDLGAGGVACATSRAARPRAGAGPRSSASTTLHRVPRAAAARGAAVRRDPGALLLGAARVVRARRPATSTSREFALGSRLCGRGRRA